MRLFGRNTRRVVYYMIFGGFCMFIYVQFSGSGPQDPHEVFKKFPENMPDVIKRVNKDPNVHQMELQIDANERKDPNNIVLERPNPGNDNQPGFAAPKKHGPMSYLTPGKRGNYEPPELPPKHGPGEGGSPVYTSMEEKAEVDRALRYDGFNMPASNKITMNRTIPDGRLDECKYWQYPPEDELPTASVVVIFYDEGLSPLIRTVHTIVDRSPKKLLKEVVMVDDFSERKEFQPPNGYLYKYMQEHFGDLVKIYRTERREGLIRARNFGAEKSVGDVVVFLDAHCECNKNWLVPLLSRIAYDRTILAVPLVDFIDGNTFRYTPYSNDTHHRGIFEWGFFYKENHVPQKELQKHKHFSEPYWAPTHAGGLLAVDRKYFFELGGYDPGLRIWGGENFELAFKIWQCGGSSEWVPCSRVGHVYRAGPRAAFKSGVKNDHLIPSFAYMNYKRVVEVWMDGEYKEYFYRMLPEIRQVDVGDLSSQFAIKKKYNCKSFKWFMENVAYDVPQRFPYPPPLVGWGEISTVNTNQCFDAPGHAALTIWGCHHSGGSQLFRFNTKGQIGKGEEMVEVDSNGKLFLKMSSGSQTGPWELSKDTHAFYHTKRKKCIEVVGHDALLRECDPSKGGQKWFIREIHPWKHLYQHEAMREKSIG